MATKLMPRSILAAEGGSPISDAKYRHLYAAMLKCRMLAEHAGRSRKQLRSGFSGAGLEAAMVGAAIDLRRRDWIAPAEQDVACSFLKGVPLKAIVSRLTGKDAEVRLGMAVPAQWASESAVANILPPTSNATLRLNLAAGVALACVAKGSGSVVMVFAWDGLPAAVPLDETLRLAAAHRLPLLVLVDRRRESAAAGKRKRPQADSANRFERCGVPVIPVDGNDVVAMYRVGCESIHKARHGGGPTLIEAADGDLAVGASKKGAKLQLAEDPIEKMEAYLAAKGLFSGARKRRIVDDFKRELMAAEIAPTSRPPKRR